ncbi:TonB-dependent receptor [Guyparkeria sp. SCN-R1]|uniref:TonB-dependent receptor domain-containing protein n=1 Tax=Guyparkeria sp. SCN-R1 TaxID=2341113 RepID=UPI000F654663|nr:TonB-dependent receptor [Guyparkeria sp. SCN-R1]RRQ20497.1 TonB-dependent receptor [Guyparkeria sp. SCN-R1]
MSTRRPRSTPFRRHLLAASILAGSTPALADEPTTAVTAAPAQSLSTVVVTAAGFEQDKTQAPASISVITRDELERKDANSIAEIVDDIEGVDVGGSPGKTGGKEIRMRGLPADYTLILIDGRRQNVAGNVTPNGFNSTQTSFLPPPSAIERIEVIRGPMSTLYGSDAMGGVINIITRKVPDEWTHSLTVDGTLNEDSDYGNDRAISLYSAGPVVKDKVGAQFRARVYKRDESDLEFLGRNGDVLAVDQRGPSPVEADIYSVGGKLSFTPTDDQEFWIDAESARQKYDNSEGQLGTLGARGYGPEQRYLRDQVAVGHDGRVGPGDWISSLMVNRTETEGRLIPPGTPGKVGGADRELTTENIVLDTKYTLPLGDHSLTVGGQWWDASMTDGVASDEFEQTTWALFAEDEWFLRDDLALTLGARYDQHDAFGGQLSPRAYLVYNATDEWTVKGGVSRGYKTPGLEALADGIVGFSGQGTIPLIGNPDLEPEKSTSAELAFLYEGDNGVSAGATLFYNEFTDKIAAGPDIPNCGYAADPNRPGCISYGDFPDLEFYGRDINIDEAWTRGIELTGRLPIGEDWSLSANYTYTDSEQETGSMAGEPLTDTPEHMANLRLAWAATEKLDTWIAAHYESERYRDRERVRGQPSYDDLGDFKAFTLVNLGGSYRLTPNVTLNATVYNLFDKDMLDYRYAGFTNRDGDDVYGNTYANPDQGRRLWLSINTRF